MKVFFGCDLDRMLAEMKGRGVDTVRLHVLPAIEGRQLLLKAHVTAFNNEQVFESVIDGRCSVEGVPEPELDGFARREAEEMRAGLVDKLDGFEVKYGILQQ